MRDSNLKITVIAGYRFFDIKDPVSLQPPLQTFCRELGLVGSVILSQEGINSYISGTVDAIERYKNHVHGELGFPAIDYKTHESLQHPWRRMYVKVRKEIISMGVSDIRPADFTAQNLSPREFKKWMDEKRDITIVDTRNTYEVRLGKFQRAIDLQVQSFKEFAKKAKELPAGLKKKPVVMYCTGGIRCEKASALFLKHYGFEEVYQLEGGILKYFKDVGGEHYEGECLVFDQRVGLAPNEAEKTTCIRCNTPLKPSDRENPKYIAFHSCPYCVL